MSRPAIVATILLLRVAVDNPYLLRRQNPNRGAYAVCQPVPAC
jgi:hypothetical protein